MTITKSKTNWIIAGEKHDTITAAEAAAAAATAVLPNIPTSPAFGSSRSHTLPQGDLSLPSNKMKTS